MAPRIGLDTNILLRFVRSSEAQDFVILSSMRRLHDSGCRFCLTPQNIGEFWNVSTRPVNRNGFGLSPHETLLRLNQIEQSMTLLPDNARVYTIWRRLLIDHAIQGVQVHDAHLAASLAAHGIRRLLTLNTADFKRFTHLTVLRPEDI